MVPGPANSAKSSFSAISSLCIQDLTSSRSVSNRNARLGGNLIEHVKYRKYLCPVQENTSYLSPYILQKPLLNSRGDLPSTGFWVQIQPNPQSLRRPCALARRFFETTHSTGCIILMVLFSPAPPLAVDAGALYGALMLGSAMTIKTPAPGYKVLGLPTNTGKDEPSKAPISQVRRPRW